MVFQNKLKLCALLIAQKLPFCGKNTFFIAVIQLCLYKKILHMDPRNRVHIYISENTGKSPEILILKPASAASFIYLYCQLILFILYKRCNVKLSRGKAVLTVPYKASVKPHIEGSFHTLEGKKKFLSLQAFFQFKFLYIASHRIVFSGNPGRAKLFLSVPGIHGVNIMHMVIALGLDMTWNLNPSKMTDVIAFPVKIFFPSVRILTVGKAPFSVQILAQRRFFFQRSFCFLLIEKMIRMCFYAVYLKNFRIFKPLQRCFCYSHKLLPSKYFCLSSFYGTGHACHKLLLHQEKDQSGRNSSQHNCCHHHTIIRRIRGAHCRNNKRQGPSLRRLQSDQRPQIIVPAVHKGYDNCRSIGRFHSRHKDLKKDPKLSHTVDSGCLDQFLGKAFCILSEKENQKCRPFLLPEPCQRQGQYLQTARQ